MGEIESSVRNLVDYDFMVVGKSDDVKLPMQTSCSHIPHTFTHIGQKHILNPFGENPLAHTHVP